MFKNIFGLESTSSVSSMSAGLGTGAPAALDPTDLPNNPIRIEKLPIRKASLSSSMIVAHHPGRGR